MNARTYELNEPVVTCVHVLDGAKIFRIKEVKFTNPEKGKASQFICESCYKNMPKSLKGQLKLIRIVAHSHLFRN